MVKIRQAKVEDIPQIINLALEALNKEPYEELIIDESKVKQMVRSVVCSNRHFSWVCEKNKEIKGVVGAIITPNIFYHGNNASVLMFYCKERGEGVKLLRKLVEWKNNIEHIKYLEFTLERNMDKRIPNLLKRLGLTTKLPIVNDLR